MARKSFFWQVEKLEKGKNLIFFYMLCMVVYVVKCGNEKKIMKTCMFRGSRECVCKTVYMCGCVEVKN